MAIIIIAADLPIGEPAPIAPAAPAAVAPPQAKPAKPVVSPEEYRTQRPEFFEDAKNMAAQYQQADPSMRESLLEQFYAMPMGKSTVGRWLTSLYMNILPNKDQAQQEARLQIWNALEKGGSVENIFGYLSDFIKGQARTDLGKEKKGFSADRYNKALATMKPYLTAVQNHDATMINPDLLERIDNGEISPQDAAFEQYKRTAWNDVPDENGVSRVDKAKAAWEEAIKRLEAPKYQEMKRAMDQYKAKIAAEPARRKKLEEDAKKVANGFHPLILKSGYPNFDIGVKPLSTRQEVDGYKKEIMARGAQAGLDPAKYVQEGQPYYLSGDMVESRITPEMLSKMWESMGAGPSVSADAQEMEMGEGFGYNPSTDEGHNIEKLRSTVPMTEVQKKTIMDEAPYSFLQEFEDDPETQRKVEERIPAIKPTINIDGRPAKNPSFKPAIMSIINSLYGPSSPPRTNPRGKPIAATPQQEANTKAALRAVGDFYASTLDKEFQNMKESDRLKKLESELEPFVAQPLAFKHYADEFPLKGREQMKMAMREVMLDILNYLGNDSTYQQLQNQLGGMKAVAEFERWIRTASFVYINRMRAVG